MRFRAVGTQHLSRSVVGGLEVLRSTSPIPRLSPRYAGSTKEHQAHKGGETVTNQEKRDHLSAQLTKLDDEIAAAAKACHYEEAKQLCDDAIKLNGWFLELLQTPTPEDG